MFNKCPLCSSTDTVVILKSHQCRTNRVYHKCNRCSLIFVDRRYLLTLREEEKRYFQHNNNSEDKGYIKFHKTLFNPLIKYIDKNMIGLDYGSGKDSAIYKLIKNEHIKIKKYDPLFFNNKKILNQNYDFLVCIETLEHLKNLELEFNLFNKLVLKNGYLGFMTSLYSNEKYFKDWYYKNDLTHINFFHFNTLKFIEQKYNWKLVYNNQQNCFIYQK